MYNYKIIYTKYKIPIRNFNKGINKIVSMVIKYGFSCRG